MCGINGIINGSESVVTQMNIALSKRGPDNMEHTQCDNLFLGHTRLAILDLDPRSNQPMHKHNLSISYNGEIYNFQILRDELIAQGYSFHTEGDTEVILSLYDAYGVKAFEKLNGIFAFSIYDHATQKLTLVRDDIGIKPLFYTHFDNQFLFSSELSGILAHPEVRRELNLEAFYCYLDLLYVPAPLTIVSNVFKLMPGHYMEIDCKTLVKTSTAYSTLFSQQGSLQPDSKEIKQLLSQSVQDQLIADVDVGLFLSGGLDSSIVLHEAMEKNIKLHTFSTRFEVDPSEDEKFNQDASLARMLSEKYGTTHHELTIRAQDFYNSFDGIIADMDEPIANPTALSTWLLSQEARKYCKVVLGGDGGDECWAGYTRYRIEQKLSQLRPFCSPFKSIIHLFTPKALFASDADFFLKYHKQESSQFCKIYSAQASIDLVNQYMQAYQRTFSANYLMLLDIMIWICSESLMRSDRMSMAHGIEYRVPLLDKRLLSHSQMIDSHYKMSKDKGKKLLFDLYRDVLPDEIINKTKTGWFSPASKWLRTDLQPLAKELLSKEYNPVTADLFDFPALQNALEDHLEQKGYHLNSLWAIMIIQAWIKQYSISLPEQP